MSDSTATTRIEIEVRPLAPADLGAACTLLAAEELPTADLADPAISLLGAFRDRALVGVIGLESYEPVGLLRSLAVARDQRGHGVARQLCERLQALASERGLSTLFLLTTTAADYFAKLGFALVDREVAPPAIRGTTQFASLCPSSARLMRRDLDP